MLPVANDDMPFLCIHFPFNTIYETQLKVITFPHPFSLVVFDYIGWTKKKIWIHRWNTENGYVQYAYYPLAYNFIVLPAVINWWASTLNTPHSKTIDRSILFHSGCLSGCLRIILQHAIIPIRFLLFPTNFIAVSSWYIVEESAHLWAKSNPCRSADGWEAKGSELWHNGVENNVQEEECSLTNA